MAGLVPGHPDGRGTVPSPIDIAGTSPATKDRPRQVFAPCTKHRRRQTSGLGVIVMSMRKPPGNLCRIVLHAGAPAALALAIAGTLQAAAQSREQRPPAFTQEQVQRGKEIYQKNCQDCHGSTLDNGEFGGAPLKGSYFRQHWGSGDVSALFGYVNTLMPLDRPGQLSAQSYVDLTAFLLSNNGYAPGTEELTADEDAQRKMTMKK